MGESCRRCGRARPAGPSPRRRPPHSLGRPACTNIPPAQFTVRRWGRRDPFAGCRAGSWRRARTRACRGQRFSGRGRCAGRQLLVWNARALGGRGGSRPRMLWAGRGGSGGGGGGGRHPRRRRAPVSPRHNDRAGADVAARPRRRGAAACPPHAATASQGQFPPARAAAAAQRGRQGGGGRPAGAVAQARHARTTGTSARAVGAPQGAGAGVWRQPKGVGPPAPHFGAGAGSDRRVWVAREQECRRNGGQGVEQIGPCHGGGCRGPSGGGPQGQQGIRPSRPRVKKR